MKKKSKIKTNIIYNRNDDGDECDRFPRSLERYLEYEIKSQYVTMHPTISSILIIESVGKKAVSPPFVILVVMGGVRYKYINIYKYIIYDKSYIRCDLF